MNRYKCMNNAGFIVADLYLSVLPDEDLLLIAQAGDEAYRPTDETFFKHYMVVDNLSRPDYSGHGPGYYNPCLFIGQACEILYVRGVWDETDFDYWNRKVS
jgi:hypothetical protein